jgi:hypothetical protein
MSLMNRIARFARSPQGRATFNKARRYAESPQGRARIEQARRQLASRGQPKRGRGH